MKKHLLYFVSLVCVALSAGCEKEINWDYPDLNIIISLEDGDGNMFALDHPSGFRNRVGSNSVVYDGKTYTLTEEQNTRAEQQLPEWKGFRMDNVDSRDNPKLLFGQFSIDTKQYRDEPFTIKWADGSTSELTFDLYSTSNGKKNEPTIHQAVRVTGGTGAGSKSDNSLLITIRKQ